MKNRVFAWINLAYRFAVHVLIRLPRRALGKAKDFERFMGTVGPEGYVPFSATERARFPEFTQCFHCGLCSLAGDPPASAWDEPWTFVVGAARSVDRAKLVDAQLHPVTLSPAPTAICPAGVPIDFMAATLQRMAASTGSAA